MAKKSNAYWERRKAQNMFDYMADAEQVADEISALYLKASRYISAELDAIFERYKKKHHLSEAEAYRLLNSLHDKTSIDELKEALRADKADRTKADILAELESPAYQARLERLQQTQNQLELTMQNVYQQEKLKNTSHYVDLAKESYYKSIFDIQQRTGLGFSFNVVDAKAIDRVINSKWSGENYSKRIWKNTQALAQDLKEELLINLVTGRTDREVAEIIQNKFSSGASEARRLVRTESNHLANQMEMKSYEECDIDWYLYVATLDLRTSSKCRELDGKRFKVSEQQPGKNCPPMHPWCRSTTICDITEEELAGMERRARDPVTGKNIKVPANMTYNEWYKNNVIGKPEAAAEEKKIKNRSADREQYKKYRKFLGDVTPKTLDSFQKIKYNKTNEWDKLKKEFKIVNQYEVVSGKVSPSDILRLDEKLRQDKMHFNSRFRSQGNIAIAEYGGDNYIAHSKVKNKLSKGYLNYTGKSKFAFESEKRVFKTKVLPDGTGWDRKVDSEAKLFEHINSVYSGKEAKPTLNMVSNYPMCESCLSVMEQFKVLHPDIQVNIVQKKVIKNGKN